MEARARTIPRQVEKIAGQQFDVVVIGGGINGAGIAWDAAMRGLHVALIEKGDFGAGASSGCFKIVHGGMRYLQHLDFSRLRQSVREQRTLRRIAASFLQPLPILVPCYGKGKRGPIVLRTALNIYELFSGDRNREIQPECFLPQHIELSAAEVAAAAPGLPRKGLQGGVVFYDAQMNSPERLVQSVVHSAAQAGATVCDYLELVRSASGQNSEWHLWLRDNIAAEQLPVKARAVICACGAWNNQVLRRLNGPSVRQRRFVRGIQVVLPPILNKYTLAVESAGFDRASIFSRGGRSYFLMPWEGFTIAGTLEKPVKDMKDPFIIGREETDQLLKELRSGYDDSRLTVENVLSTFGGHIPLEYRSIANSPDYRVERKDEVVDLSKKNILFSVTGVKFTTFRALAEAVVDRIIAKLRIRAGRCQTERTLLCADFNEPRRFAESSFF